MLIKFRFEIPKRLLLRKPQKYLREYIFAAPFPQFPSLQSYLHKSKRAHAARRHTVLPSLIKRL